MFSFFIEIIFALVLVCKCLSQSDPTDGNLAMAHETARLALSSQVEWCILVKNTVKILYAIYNTLMLACSTLYRLKIPLDSDPNRVTCFWIINELAYVSNRPNMLRVLEPNIFVEVMLLLFIVLDTNALS